MAHGLPSHWRVWLFIQRRVWTVWSRVRHLYGHGAWASLSLASLALHTEASLDCLVSSQTLVWAWRMGFPLTGESGSSYRGESGLSGLESETCMGMAHGLPSHWRVWLFIQRRVWTVWSRVR